jgi:hypothetical protein
MSIIYKTGLFSLFIQAFTGIFSIYALMIKVTPAMAFIKNLLWIEVFVQIIEGIFYIWLVMNFSKIKNVTKYRYYDWILTTPTMLFTYCMYLYYINMPDEKMKTLSFYDAIETNIFDLLPIFVFNTTMLFFGYLAEIGKMKAVVSAVLGFIPFIIMFYLIYDTYAKYTSVGKMTFFYFSGVWSLYGFASVLSYKYKNSIYNILDLLSKNFFGIFLSGVLLYSH